MFFERSIDDSEEYARAQEDAEEIKDEVERHCETCYICGDKILPRHTAVTLDEIHFAHDWHVLEASGRDLAIDEGADPDLVDRYMDMD